MRISRGAAHSLERYTNLDCCDDCTPYEGLLDGSRFLRRLAEWPSMRRMNISKARVIVRAPARPGRSARAAVSRPRATPCRAEPLSRRNPATSTGAKMRCVSLPRLGSPTSACGFDGVAELVAGLTSRARARRPRGAPLGTRAPHEVVSCPRRPEVGRAGVPRPRACRAASPSRAQARTLPRRAFGARPFRTDESRVIVIHITPSSSAQKTAQKRKGSLLVYDIF